jgi:hypothetical protein
MSEIANLVQNGGKWGFYWGKAGGVSGGLKQEISLKADAGLEKEWVISNEYEWKTLKVKRPSDFRRAREYRNEARDFFERLYKNEARGFVERLQYKLLRSPEAIKYNPKARGLGLRASCVLAKT